MQIKSGSYVWVDGERVLRNKTGTAAPVRRPSPPKITKRPPGISPSIKAKPPKRHPAAAVGIDSNPTKAGSE